MSDYISRDEAIESVAGLVSTMSVCVSKDECIGMQSMKIRSVGALRDVPAADVVKVVRCRECKHRIVNENYGKRGYMKLKAMCDLDTNDCFQLGRCAEDDDWFCADGERKDGAE